MTGARLLPVLISLGVGLACPVPARAGEADPPNYPDKANLLVWRDAEGKEHPVRTAADWARRRQHILANMQRVMGPLPGPERKVPLAVKVTEEVKGTGWVRKKLTFAVEKDDRLPAYLFIPTGQKRKVPGILCLHQTNGKLGKAEPAGLGGNPNLHYALHLAE